MPAVIHRPPDVSHKIVERPALIAKERHLLARFRQMRRQQNVIPMGDLFAAPIQILGSRKQRMRRQSPIRCGLQRFNCKINKLVCAFRRTHVDQLREPPGSNGWVNPRNQFWERGQICNCRRPKSFRLGESFCDRCHVILRGESRLFRVDRANPISKRFFRRDLTA